MKKYLFFIPLASMLFFWACEEENDEPETVVPVTACFSVPDSIFAGVPAEFNADCSENANSYIWAISDITSKTGEQVTHTFDEPGEYIIVLLAEGADDEDEITKTVTVYGEKISYLSGTVSSNRTLYTDSIYIVDGIVGIDAVLSIEAGTLIKFQSDGLIDCDGGKIIAKGTSDLPIIFTSIKDDAYGGDTNKDGSSSSPAPGDWDFVTVDIENSASEFEYCKFFFGGQNTDFSYSLNIASSNCIVSNCTFAYNKSRDLGALNLEDSKGGNTITSNIFYNNIVPMTINGLDDYDDSNIFHNPADATAGNTKNGIFIREIYGNNITGQRSWAETEVPFVIKDNIDFEAGNSLTLSPGVVIKLDAERSIFLDGGVMKAIGTSELPIVFTSYLDDATGGDTNGDGTLTSPSAGDWNYLKVVGSDNNQTELIYCNFQYGGNDVNFDFTVGIYSDLTKVDNCTFKNNLGAIKGALNAERALNGTVITNNVFYSNTIPLSIGLMVNIDNSNVFHNPDSPEITNTKNGIFIGDVYQELTGQLTWAETEVPFVINETYDVNIEGSNTLTLADDVIIKLGSGRSISYKANNLLIGDNVWFTSYFDDSLGGDTNGDGAITSPAEGDWYGIYNQTSSEYEIWDNILFDEP